MISGIVARDGTATFDGMELPRIGGVRVAVEGRLEGVTDLARLWEERREGCLGSLRGSFAVAIWDAVEKKLVLARDAFGTKPLFVAHDHGRFLFATEPAAILASLRGRPRVDAFSIDDVLAFGWLERRRTGYEEIERLYPGEVAVYRDGKLERRIRSTPPVPGATARGTLAVQLERTAKAGLEAGGETGVILSGSGSFAMLEAASRVSREPLRTYAATFEGNDGAVARAAAERSHARHRDIEVGGDELPRLVESILGAADRPTADPELVALHVVCRAAREDVGACLSADGSEEILGAGARHRWMRSSGARPRGPVALLPLLHAGLDVLPPLAAPRLRAAMRFRLRNEEQRYVSALVVTEDGLRRRLFAQHRRRGAHRRNESERELWSDFGIAGDLDARMRRHDRRHALPNRVLERAHRAAAATGVERRFPFLDEELAVRIGTIEIDRNAFGAGAPCGIPVDRWMRSELAPLVDGYLVGSRLANDGWLDSPTIAAVVRAHRSRRAELGRTLFALLALEIWYRKRILGI